MMNQVSDTNAAWRTLRAMMSQRCFRVEAGSAFISPNSSRAAAVITANAKPVAPSGSSAHMPASTYCSCRRPRPEAP